jgi:hypothetical protein
MFASRAASRLSELIVRCTYLLPTTDVDTSMHHFAFSVSVGGRIAVALTIVGANGGLVVALA